MSVTYGNDRLEMAGECFSSSASAILTALKTISFQSIKAAIATPVKV